MSNTNLSLLDKKLTKELVFNTDEVLGISRRRAGSGFAYYHPDGKKVADADTLQRIRNLVLPPQWERVWICPLPNGYLQATGRDAKGRKQYRYHDRFVEHRQNYKFDKMGDFAERLPYVREVTAGYLRQRNWTREKVLALVVAVLDDCGVRIGNQAYKQQNGTIGLTTLRRKHLHFEEKNLVLDYPGKSGQRRKVTLWDRRLAKLVKQCSELPGHEVFCYFDEDGKRWPVESEEVNAFIHEIAGEQFSSKDFRTWTATSLAVYFYEETVTEITAHPRWKMDTVLVKKVASELGNTPAVCRNYYIHPKVLNAATSLEIPSFEYKPEEENFFHSHDLRSWEKVALEVMRR
ncbi:MAG: DNA topoisomerase IB [Bacteroidetes bacterium]|nr:DNA topoisomerase IB [Bacteroidota bacterium]